MSLFSPPAGGCFSSKCSITSLKLLTPYILIPSISAPSSAFSLGKYTSSNPCLLASRTIGSTPFIFLRYPSNESSPKKSLPSGLNSISSHDSRYASAIPRSNTGPSFFKSAGARDITTFWFLTFGDLKSEFFIAAETLSRDSSTALSGKPTTVKACKPFERSTSISIICAESSVVCAL